MNKTVVMQVCLHCGKTFETLCHTAKYCSATCREQEYRERRNSEDVPVQKKNPSLDEYVKGLEKKHLSYAEVQMQESLRMIQEANNKPKEQPKRKGANWWEE